MRVDWATLCRYAENTGSGLNILGANLELAVAPTLPIMIQCGLAVKIGEINDLPAIDQIIVQVRSPQGNVIVESRADLAVELNEAAVVPEGFKLQQSVVTGLQFLAEEHGVYTISVASGDKMSYEVTFAVVSGT